MKPLRILEHTWALTSFAAFYLAEVVLSNLRVARDVLRPRLAIQPAVYRLPVEGLTDRQLLLAANLITMTPGTLTLDVAEDRRSLLIHSMAAPDPEAQARHLENTLLRRIRRVF